MKITDFIFHRLLKKPYRLAKIYDGGNGQPVVLLHGIASSSKVWQPLYKLQSAGNLRLIAFDLLGFGESPKPEWQTYNIDEHARAVVASIKRLRLKQPITLVGHSMGCLIAAHIAAKHPRLVKRAVLYQPPLFADMPEYKAYSRQQRLYFKALGHVAGQQELILSYSRFIGKWANRSTAFNLDEASWLPFERSLKNTIMQQKAFEDLRSINVPTDIIHGRMDMIVVRTDIQKILSSNPNIQFHTINETHGLSTRSAKFLQKLLTRKQ